MTDLIDLSVGLREHAQSWLHRAEFPTSGPLFEAALGDVYHPAHKMAWLLKHANNIEQQVRMENVQLALRMAFLAGATAGPKTLHEIFKQEIV